MIRFSLRSTFGFLVAAALLLPGFAPAAHHESATERALIVGEQVELEGKVISVDAETRTVVIEGELGRQVSIAAPEEAPNFDQIKVGDPVRATYIESIALAIAPVAAAEPGASVSVAVAAAPPGATPGVAFAEQIQLRAVVNAVDTETRSVTLDVPDGSERTLKVGEAVNLERVKIGEQVSVTLTRALAISIDTK